MRNKRFKHKHNKRKPAKHTQIKRFKPVSDARLREKRAAAVAQESESRYQYHQLRLAYQKGVSACTHL